MFTSENSTYQTFGKIHLFQRSKLFFNITKLKILQRYSENYSRKSSENAKEIFTKSYTKQEKEETAIRQQLSLEKFKAEINLQEICSQNYLERFQTLDTNMMAHFTIIYNNDICNSLNENELWENECLKEQQKSVDIFDTKRDWFLNKTTTKFCNNSEEVKPKKVNKVNKTMTITTTEKRKMVEGKIDIKIVKIEAEVKVLVKKEQITMGLQNKIRKLIRKKITLHQRNQEINTTLRKISINLGNSIVLLYNKKKKNI